MKTLRGMVCGIAVSLVGCAARPVAAPAEVPKKGVAAVANVEAEPIDAVVESSSTLASLVARAREDARDVIVFTKACKTSKGVWALERAGLAVTCSENEFAKMPHDKLRPYDVVVLEKAPEIIEAQVAEDTAARNIAVIATWQGDDATPRAKYGLAGAPVELADGKGTGPDAKHFAIWQYDPRDAPVRKVLVARGLGLSPSLPPTITSAADGSATVVGELRRLPTGEAVIESASRHRTRVVLWGDAATKLAAAASEDEATSAMAYVRGRLRYYGSSRGTDVWDLDVTSVDAHLDDAKMRALAKQHSTLFDRATKHVTRGELVAAADDLDRAANVFDEPLRGKGGPALRTVRFDRTMASRLREVAADGGSGEKLIERVAQFKTFDAMEKDIVEGAGKLARAKLLAQYRAEKSEREAERIAHVYFYTVEIVHGDWPAPIAEMMNRFLSLRSGGMWRPRPFYLQGEEGVEAGY